jgi:N-methylhydantoinase A
LTIPLPTGRLDRKRIKELEAAFGDEHEKTYGHRATVGEQITLVNLRVRGKGFRRQSYRNEMAVERKSGPETRKAYFGKEYGLLDARLLSRAQLKGKGFQKGPALIDEYDSTTVVPPNARVGLDEINNLRIKLT